MSEPTKRESFRNAIKVPEFLHKLRSTPGDVAYVPLGANQRALNTASPEPETPQRDSLNPTAEVECGQESPTKDQPVFILPQLPFDNRMNEFLANIDAELKKLHDEVCSYVPDNLKKEREKISRVQQDLGKSVWKSYSQYRKSMGRVLSKYWPDEGTTKPEEEDKATNGEPTQAAEPTKDGEPTKDEPTQVNADVADLTVAAGSDGFLFESKKD